MNKMGFELKISGCTYLVKCDTATTTNTSERDTSNKVNLRIRVFEDGKFVKLDRDSYVAEKITDFIRNCINGQDSCYWDWNEPNRHLEEPKYLKWEDLDFTKDTKCQKAKMNGKEYTLHYFILCDNLKEVLIQDNDGSICTACNDKFFNDLHLESVE